MTWVKIDDQFADHPKVAKAGPMAAWLYVSGLCYCARYLTDGFIPSGQVRKLADLEHPGELAAALVTVGLWEAVDGGYLVHDYHDYQPTADAERAKRAARATAGSKGGHSTAVSKQSSKTHSKIAAKHTANAPAKHTAKAQQNTHPDPDPDPDPDPLSTPQPLSTNGRAPAVVVRSDYVSTYRLTIGCSPPEAEWSALRAIERLRPEVGTAELGEALEKARDREAKSPAGYAKGVITRTRAERGPPREPGRGWQPGMQGVEAIIGSGKDEGKMMDIDAMRAYGQRVQTPRRIRP